jgi:Cu-processing system permease protein
MTDLLTIARLECVTAVRLKWVRLLTVAYALLAAAAAYSAGAASDLSGADGFARTTMALIPVALVMIPLAAIVLGVSGQSAEPGSEPFLFAQPVSRRSIVVGRWAGELAALSGSIVVGFGAGAVVVALGSGTADWPSFVFFVAAAILLGAIFLSIAAVVAAATDKRVMALGVGIFAWFMCVLLYDGAALSMAGWLSGSLGGRILFASIFFNPADLVRVAMLQLAGTPHVLGAAGEAWRRFLGGDAAAAVIAAAALIVWTVAPLEGAVLVMRRRDV